MERSKPNNFALDDNDYSTGEIQRILKGMNMRNNLKKLLKTKKVLASFLLVAGLSILPSLSNAQGATEPWVGTISGDNINLATTDEMSAIREMLNNQDYSGAVYNTQKYDNQSLLKNLIKNVCQIFILKRIFFNNISIFVPRV